VPPTINTPELTERITAGWENSLGEEAVISNLTKGMGAEDFPFFVIDPEIPSVYWQIGGTPQEAFDAAAAGGPPVPSHHSPLFRIEPEPSVRAGVESTVVALMELLPAE
jgi:metal-dependent amidase/aminoacylase/carboxypeptidase family protein